MSSNEFETTFHHAASLVQIQLGSLIGVDKVLESLRARLKYCEADPREDRRLFFEPRIDSQQLGVPEDTAEEVARRLRELSVLRLWARVKCPVTSPDEDCTITETDHPTQFLAEPNIDCPHCGGQHKVTQSDLEVLYALNISDGREMRAFDYGRLNAESNLKLTTSQGSLASRRLESITRRPIRSNNDLQSALVIALQGNGLAQSVPSPSEVWWHLWIGPLLAICLMPVAVCLVNWLAGPLMAMFTGVLTLLVVYATLHFNVKAKLAPSALQRSVFWTCFGSSNLLILAGTAGIEFSMTEEDRLTIPWEGQKIDLPMRLAWGKTNLTLVALGVIVLILALLFLLVYDGKLGWLGPTNKNAE